MSKIVFENTHATYTLAGPINREDVHMQASILKENHTIDEILVNSNGNEVIKITDDAGNVMQVLTGYTNMYALNVMNNASGVVSVEFYNEQLKTNFGQLASRVDSIAAAQNSQATQINDINDQQATQDLAIEDLGEAVSELTPEG